MSRLPCSVSADLRSILTGSPWRPLTHTHVHTHAHLWELSENNGVWHYLIGLYPQNAHTDTHWNTHAKTNQSQQSLSASRGLPHPGDVWHKATEQLSYPSALHTHTACAHLIWNTLTANHFLFVFGPLNPPLYKHIFSRSVWVHWLVSVISSSSFFRPFLLLDLCSSGGAAHLTAYCRFLYSSLSLMQPFAVKIKERNEKKKEKGWGNARKIHWQKRWVPVGGIWQRNTTDEGYRNVLVVRLFPCGHSGCLFISD